MKDESPLPATADRATFQAEMDRKATRSPRPDGAYPWSRWTPTSS
jgi:hypothetical protein